MPCSMLTSITTSGPSASRTSHIPDSTQVMLSASPSGTVTCSGAPGSSDGIHSDVRASSASPAR
jgi:hypothetical protein